MPIPPSDAHMCMCVLVLLSVSACVVSVIVKLSVLPPSVIDWCYRNHFHYYQFTLHGKFEKHGIFDQCLETLGIS